MCPSQVLIVQVFITPITIVYPHIVYKYPTTQKPPALNCEFALIDTTAKESSLSSTIRASGSSTGHRNLNGFLH